MRPRICGFKTEKARRGAGQWHVSTQLQCARLLPVSTGNVERPGP
jgi:hypothetical protein